MPELGNLKVGISVDLSGLTRGLAQAKAELDAFAKQASSSGTKATKDLETGAAKAEVEVQKLSKTASQAGTEIGRSMEGAATKANADVDRIKLGFSQLGTESRRLLGDIGGGFDNLRNRIPGLNAAVSGIQRAFTSAFSAVSGAFSRVESSLVGGAERARSALSSAASRVAQPFVSAFGAVQRGVESAVGGISSRLSSIGGSISRSVSQVGSEIGRMGSSLEGVSSRVSGFGRAFGNIFGGIGGLVRSGTSEISKLEVSIERVGKGAADVGKEVEKVASTTAKAAEGAVKAAEGAAKGAASAAKAAEGAAGGVGGGAAKAAGGAAGAGGGLLGGLGSAQIPIGLGSSIGLPAAGAIAAIGGAAVFALTPVAALAVGLAGVAATAALVFGGLGLLAGGMVLLAASTGKIDGPMNKVQGDLKGVADRLGTAVAPMAAEVLKWFDGLIPTIGNLGQMLTNWFGPRLGPLLQAASGFVNVLVGALQDLGNQLGPIFDHVLGEAPNFEAAFKVMTGFAVNAIVGLVQNLVKLSDWWFTNSPKILPIAEQVLGAIGGILQWLIGVIANWVGFVIDHWQQVMDTFQKAHDFIVPLIQKYWPQIQSLIETVMQYIVPIIQTSWTHIQQIFDTAVKYLGPLLSDYLAKAQQFWQQHGDQVVQIVTKLWDFVQLIFNVYLPPLVAFLKFSFDLMFNILGVFADLFTGNWSKLWSDVKNLFGQANSDLVGIGTALANALLGIFGTNMTQVGQVFAQGLNNVINIINGFISAVNNLPGVHIDWIGGFATPGVSAGSIGGGGAFTQAAAGTITSGPTLAGEGAAPEAVIPFDPKYRSRALGLLDYTMRRLIGPIGFGGAGLNGLGAGIADAVGAVGGQCLEWVGRVTGLFSGIPMAADLVPYITDGNDAPGEVFVSVIPPFGHTGFVAGGGLVIDSNWGLDERIQVHPEGDIPDIVGYINTGLPLGALGDVGAMAAAFVGKEIDNLAGTYINQMSGLGGIFAGLGGNILQQAIAGVKKSVFDRGGILPPGLSLAYNGTGAGELVIPPPGAGPTSSVLSGGGDQVTLLTQIRDLMQQMANEPGITGAHALKRYAGA